MRLGIRFGMFVLLVGTAFAQTQPDAVEILAKVKATWMDLKSYDFDWTTTLHNSKSGSDETVRIRVASAIEPDRYRVEMHGIDLRPDDADASTPSLDGSVMTYDGSIFSIYAPAPNEYRTAMITAENLGRDAKPSKVNIDEGIGQYARLVEGFEGAHFLRQETISNGGGAIADCFVIEKAPGEMMWIDKSNYHVVRMEQSEIDGAHLTAVISVKLNESLPDDLFKFVPPPGARNLGWQ
jgi:outer membrane lipoprotein-sorting protein